MANLSALVGEIEGVTESVKESLLRLAEGGPDEEVYKRLDNAVERVMHIAIDLMVPGGKKGCK